MSWRQRRLSNEMDSVNRATSAAGPPAKRPLRETGEALVMRFKPRPNVPEIYGKSLRKKKRVPKLVRWGEAPAEP